MKSDSICYVRVIYIKGSSAVNRIQIVCISNSLYTCFASVSSHVRDFDSRSKVLIAIIPNRAFGIINFAKLSESFIIDILN